MSDRRTALRQPMDLYFNKFLQGYPYLCRSVDLSAQGMLVETFVEPEFPEDRFPLELRLPDDDEAVWVWARHVRRQGTRQALEFVSLSKPALQKLNRYLARAPMSVDAPH
jgi:PilZ domain